MRRRRFQAVVAAHGGPLREVGRRVAAAWPDHFPAPIPPVRLLDKLPAAEQKAFAQLWSDVTTLLGRERQERCSCRSRSIRFRPLSGALQ